MLLLATDPNQLPHVASSNTLFVTRYLNYLSQLPISTTYANQLSLLPPRRVVLRSGDPHRPLTPKAQGK